MKKSVFMFALAIIAMLSFSSCREDGKWEDSLFFEGDIHSKIFVKEEIQNRGLPSSKTYYYKTENFLKNFSVRGGGENKISKIEYKVSFKMRTESGDVTKSYAFTELIDPSQAVVTYNNAFHPINHTFNAKGDGEGWERERVSVFFAGEVTITAHTQLGKTMTKTLTNVPIQFTPVQ